MTVAHQVLTFHAFGTVLFPAGHDSQALVTVHAVHWDAVVMSAQALGEKKLRQERAALSLASDEHDLNAAHSSAVRRESSNTLIRGPHSACSPFLPSSLLFFH